MVSAFPSRLLVSNEDSHPDRHSALVMRNVSVRGHRTSIRLEPQLWDTLAESVVRAGGCPGDKPDHRFANYAPK